MNGPLSFKAQALDNTSPDHYQISDELLPADDQTRRRQVTNQISEVAREGEVLLQANGAELIFHRSRFLVQVYSEQLDQAGRRAPILCCGEFNSNDEPRAECENLIQAIRGFATKIGRTVEPEHIQAISGRLAKLKKKNRTGPLTVGVGIGVLLIALLLVALNL
ncbi:hypothetical protein E6C67_02035 [Azospirillum sp. TSA2s]|uniref:hypothetical protein n=1 Tax=Azospirillum sp. TSA2s TaxID=709810 RepID=UPI0010AAEFDC|nr:hypothetical protein [Azospirillum sp. TSA2s]QCG92717.1 hypothetical protein E6C67_02035 [Azospirillum sp. TSA2s]